MRMGIVLQFVVSRLRAFPKAMRGNVAMIFGIALVPLCIAVGVGLDMSRAMITHARIANALDAAGLAVGSQPGMTQDDMQKLAREYFKQNYTADEEAYGKPDEVTLSRPAGSQTITLSTNVKMPTVLMRVVGVDTMDVAAQSQITWGQTKLWVALVLDNTGSMCQYPAQPSISSCPTPDPASKIVALKTATHNLLQMLQNAASNDGDVKVSIIPFSKDVNVGTSHVADSWIDWTNWQSEPATSDGSSPKPDSSVGPGSACPWTTSTNKLKSPYGYYCVSTANGSSKVSTIPSSGLICPGVDSGNYNSGDGSTKLDASGHYYNGCYNSVATKTLTTTTAKSTPTTVKQTCTSTNGGTPSCSQTSSSTGSTTTNTSTATTDGYSGDSGPTTTTASSSTTTDGAQSCTTKKGTTTCTWTRTIVTTKVTTTVTATGAAPFNHNWISSPHSTWTGCVMDRAQDYDTENTAPSGSAKFPAENTDYCVPGTITPLAHDWDTLSSQVDAMTANGNTNQTVGLAWGWQTLTNSDPYNPGELPEDTRKVLILLTDGLNTQNRWTGTAATIDARTKAICKSINDDKITVYTVLVMAGSSSMLKGCASSPDKYFELTAADQIVSTFQSIGTQITNLRVSL